VSNNKTGKFTEQQTVNLRRTLAPWVEAEGSHET